VPRTTRLGRIEVAEHFFDGGVMGGLCELVQPEW
jgi:hypothetical protein